MEYSPKNKFGALTRSGYFFAKGIIISILIPLFYSCTSLKSISIEVAKLPLFPISEDIQSLALLNRSMNHQFFDYKSDSLEKILIGKNMELDSIFRDSIASDTCLQTAAKALFESGRFDVVIPKARNIPRNDNLEISNPLNINFIMNICQDFNVDAVLILENFSEHLSTKYYLVRDEGTYNAATDIEHKSDWRLYRPDEKKPAIRFQLADSIFWDFNRYTLKELYAQMPRTKDALTGGGIAAGLKLAKNISPTWVDQTRYYYLTGKPEIDKAIPLIKDNKWDQAAEIWSKYAGYDSKRIRAKVLFNLALAAEMDDNLDVAIELALKSFNASYSKAAEVYLRSLDAKRKVKSKESKLRY